MLFEVLDGLHVEVLRIEQLADEPLIHEVADVAAHAAESEAHLDVLLDHVLLEEAVNGERRAADTSLE